MYLHLSSGKSRTPGLQVALSSLLREWRLFAGKLTLRRVECALFSSGLVYTSSASLRQMWTAISAHSKGAMERSSVQGKISMVRVKSPACFQRSLSGRESLKKFMVKEL